MNRPCNCLNREQLFEWINMVSFAVVETALYLDTHPKDMEALKFYNETVEMRKAAMKEYSAHFSPLTLDYATGTTGKWEWVMSPWPWEGGCC